MEEEKIEAHFDDRETDIGTSFRFDGGGYLCEKFFVIGLPNNTKTKKPEILVEYPPRTELPTVKQEENKECRIQEHDLVFGLDQKTFFKFCLPKSITKKKLIINGVNNMLHRRSKIATLKRSFNFCTIHKERMYFAICVINYEPLDIPQSLINTKRKHLKHMSMDFTRIKFTPRCYCVITHSTNFNIIYQFLHSVIDREKMNFQYTMGLLNERYKSNYLSMIKKIKNTQYKEDLAPILLKYEDKVNEEVFYEHGTDRYGHLALWAFDYTMKLIDYNNLAKLLGMIMMGNSVVVRSKYAGSCSAVIFSMIVLMRPFSFAGSVVPLMIKKLEDLFASPMQIMIGTHHTQEYLESLISGGTVIVDLDKKRTEYLIEEIDQIDWELPFSKEYLIDPLKDIMQKAGGCKFTTHIINEVINIFRTYHIYLIYRLVKNLQITDVDTITNYWDLEFFSPDVMSHDYSRKEMKFLERFLGNQHAELFTNKFIEIRNIIYGKENYPSDFELVEAQIYKHVFKIHINDSKITHAKKPHSKSSYHHNHSSKSHLHHKNDTKKMI